MLTVSSKQGILLLYSPLLSASNYLPTPPAQKTGASALTDAKIHIFSKIGGFFFFISFAFNIFFVSL